MIKTIEQEFYGIKQSVEEYNGSHTTEQKILLNFINEIIRQNEPYDPYIHELKQAKTALFNGKFKNEDSSDFKALLEDGQRNPYYAYCFTKKGREEYGAKLKTKTTEVTTHNSKPKTPAYLLAKNGAFSPEKRDAHKPERKATEARRCVKL